jgi:hypothetical protein
VMNWRFVSAAIPEVISPELVLVSPPEVAAVARVRVPDPMPLRYVRPLTISRREMAFVYAGIILVTLGPLAPSCYAAN